MSRPNERPRVAISACLLGEPVRYDGGHRRASDLLAATGGQVEWVPLCPEAGAGLGVPREPMHLELRRGALRLVTNAGAADLTTVLERWATGEVERLAALRIAGFVGKSRSPSCGLRDTPRGEAEPAGSGLFTAMLRRALPDLPFSDELALGRPEAVTAFLAGVLQYHAARVESAPRKC